MKWLVALDYILEKLNLEPVIFIVEIPNMKNSNLKVRNVDSRFSEQSLSQWFDKDHLPEYQNNAILIGLRKKEKSNG